MKIIVDAFGGDHAPLSVLEGSSMAVKKLGVNLILVGNVEKLKSLADKNAIQLDGIEFAHADSIIDVEDDPRDILRAKSDSSMAIGLKMLSQGEGDAFVSAGSTSALVLGASSIVKRIKGIRRASLAPIIPTDSGCYMLLDAGANSECRPEMLQQFAIMGSCYMSGIMNINSPKVGLVNIGAEPNKGRELELATYKILQESPINFYGNVEPRDIPLGACDVVITDGFTGNVVLKMTEGMGKLISINLNNIFRKNFLTKIGALFVMKQLNGFRKKMDYTEHGGAALMGVAKPVIKAHGSSNVKAFMNAIRQARDFSQRDVIKNITESLALISNKSEK